MIRVIEKKVEIEKNGVLKHYTNFVLKCGRIEVPIKPVFADASNYKALGYIADISSEYSVEKELSNSPLSVCADELYD